MKLSEAMRLGAMSSRPGIGGFMDGDERCALAAAADAVGLEPRASIFDDRMVVDYSAMYQRFPLNHVLVPQPCGCRVFDGGREVPFVAVMRAIYHLNDRHEDWSRERIAAWVETVEAGVEAKAEQPVAAAVAQ